MRSLSRAACAGNLISQASFKLLVCADGLCLSQEESQDRTMLRAR